MQHNFSGKLDNCVSTGQEVKLKFKYNNNKEKNIHD